VSFSAPDPHTVVLRSDKPNPALPKVVMTPTLSVVNSKVAKQNDATDAADAATADRSEPFFNSESAGSGPYVLESYRANEEIRLSRNPNYWGPEPQFDEVVIRNMQAATQRLRVQRGVNEVAIDLSSRQASDLEDNPDLQVSISPSPIVFNLGMNTDPSVSEVAANKDIQTAVRYGIDYQGLLDVVGPGAVQAPGVIPSQLPGALPESDALEYDPERARQAVADSGIENPRLKLAYPSDLSVNGIEFATPAQRVKADLAKVGITADLQAIPTTTFLEQYNAGKHEMAQVYWVVNYPDPSDALKFVPGGTYAVRLKWDEGDDPPLERLAERAKVTADQARRTELFQELQTRLNEDSPWIAQFQPAQAIVGSANLTNLVLNPTWILDVAAIGSK
jgi:peptide/nickel transport system substrate-binding protein